MQALAHQMGFFLLFIHVLAGAFWVFGMIILRFIVHPHLQTLPPSQRLEKSIAILGSFFPKVIAAIFVIALTGMIMGSVYKGTPVSGLVHAKEGVWTFMAVIFGVIFFRFRRAKKLYEEENYEEAGEMLSAIPRVLIPINIVLGILAIFFGAIVAKGL